MENINLKPALRFPQYTENWITKRTGEIAPLQRGFDLPTREVIEGDFPIVYSNGILRKHNSFKVEGPGVVTGRSGTIGKVSYVEENFWPHNTSLWVTDFKNNDPKFIYYFYLMFNLERFSGGSTIPTLNRNDVHFVKKNIPSSKEEQKKISNFLSSIDERITLLKEKKDILLEFKKGVMQKIFNQEICFKDDNGNDFPDWEEKKLGKVFSGLKGKGISKDKVVEKGKNNCILYGELYTKYPEIITKVISSTNSTEGVKSKKGDLLIPASTTTIAIDLANVTAILKEDVLLGGDINILRKNEELDSSFFAYYLSNHYKTTLAKYAQGITIVHLYYSHLKNIKVLVPKPKEQTKIANYLIALDNKIEALQQKIDASVDFKKGLLQKMFV